MPTYSPSICDHHWSKSTKAKQDEQVRMISNAGPLPQMVQDCSATYTREMIAGFQATSLLIIKLAGRFLPQTLEDVQDRKD
jgi:hypothetical protein